MTPAADNVQHLEAIGDFRVWLEGVDLLTTWHSTTKLAEPRCDYYRALILRHYLKHRRKSERSKAGGRP